MNDIETCIKEEFEKQLDEILAFIKKAKDEQVVSLIKEESFILVGNKYYILKIYKPSPIKKLNILKFDSLSSQCYLSSLQNESLQKDILPKIQSFENDCFTDKYCCSSLNISSENKEESKSLFWCSSCNEKEYKVISKISSGISKKIINKEACSLCLNNFSSSKVIYLEYNNIRDCFHKKTLNFLNKLGNVKYILNKEDYPKNSMYFSIENAHFKNIFGILAPYTF